MLNSKRNRKISDESPSSTLRLRKETQNLSLASEKFFENKRKRELMAELFRLVQIENAKRKKVSSKQKRADKAKEAQVKKEAEKKVEVIR